MSDKTVSERVCAAKAEMSRLKKDETNRHGKYKYVSVDDVYGMVRPILAKHDLDLIVDMVGHETMKVARSDGGENVWATFVASVGFVGEEPQTRYLSAILTGPQTYEAAISYIAKQYLRQRFQIETGEGDLDAEEESGPPPVAKKSWQVNLDVGSGALLILPTPVLSEMSDKERDTLSRIVFNKLREALQPLDMPQRALLMQSESVVSALSIMPEKGRKVLEAMVGEQDEPPA